MSGVDIKAELEALAQSMPEPFRLREEADAFFSRPAARAAIGAGVPRIISSLHSHSGPPLARVAVMLLSRFPSALYYADLLAILRSADEETTLAFEPGLWMSDVDEASAAKDLVRLVAESGNPFPLLLLQRPAAKSVKAELESFVAAGRQPVARYARYALRYANPGDAQGGDP
jgi:hypothetical protein